MISTNKTNIYDKAIILLLASLAFGSLYIGFGALQYSRVLTILFTPMLLSKITQCNYVKPLIYFALFVVLYGAISLLWTLNPSRGMEELVYYVVHFLLFFELIIFSKYANKAFNSLSLGWMLSLSITLVIALWELTTGQHLENAFSHGDTYNAGDGLILSRRCAAVAFYNYNSYVTYICMALPFVFFPLFSKIGVKKFLVIITIIALSACVILFNASRGGLLCLLVLFFIYFIKSPGKIYAIPIFFILGFIAILYWGEDMLALISYRASDGGLTTDDGRLQIYTNAMKVFFDTLGVGAGLGGLHLYMAKYSNSVLATHNMLLEILAQFGFIIFIIFIIFLVKLFFKSLRIKDYSRKVTSYMIFFSFPIMSIIDSNYLLSPHFYAFIASIIIIVNYEQIRSIRKHI